MSSWAVITVNFQASPGTPDVHNSSGLLLGDGPEVRIGWFDTSTFDFGANGGNLNAVDGVWTQLGNSVNIGSVGGQFGRFTGSEEGDLATFTGKQIFLWILETSDGNAVQGDYGNVTEHGIFFVDDVSNDWVFPASDLAPNDETSIFTADLFNDSSGTTPIGTALWGSLEGKGGDSFGHLRLAAVPEPEEYAFIAGLSLVVFAGLRRRFARA